MATLSTISSSDIIGPSGYGNWASDCLETKPGRVFDLAAATARLWGKEQLASQFDNAYNALSVASLPQDLYSVYSETTACASVACSHGFASKEFLDSGRKWGRSVCSLTSDGYSAGKFLEVGGIKSEFVEKLTPVIPACNLFVYASDAFDNLQVLVTGSEGGALEPCVKELHNKYWWQNLWEFIKNGTSLGWAIASVVGVAFSAVSLFAISLGTMILSFVAFFAKQEVREYSVVQGLQNIYRNRN